MRVILSLKTVRELNEILGMLESNDPESKRLGFDLLKENNFFRKVLSTCDYKTNTGKVIPVYWYFDKSQKLYDEQKSDWYQPVTPIIRSILLGENKFTAHLCFLYEQYHTDLGTGSTEEILNF